MGEAKVSLKLLVDTKRQKVLFAEAGKEFVDFLLNIFSLPIGTVVRLLTEKEKGMVGCLGDLYESIESLNNDYFQEDLDKDSVLNPSAAVRVPLLSLNNDAPTTGKFYQCNVCYKHISDRVGTKCPSCKSHSMSDKQTYVAPNGSVGMTFLAKGYVKGVVTYMVMDNLEVKPMSTISSVTLLNKFNVENVSSLVEKEVQVGLNEGVAMLKASLESRAVLTAIFLGNKN